MARVVKEIQIQDIEVPKSRLKRVDLETEVGALILESIKDQGMLHPPLVQPPAETGGKYRLVFGRTRFAAAKKLNLEKIRVTVDDSMSDEEVEYAILAENLCRSGQKDPTEHRKAIRRWWEIHQKNLEAVGKTDRQATPQGAAAHGNPRWVKNDQIVGSRDDETSTRAPGALVDSEPDQEEQRDEDVAKAAEEPGSEAPSLDSTNLGFTRKIQEATGVSHRKAKYDAAIAKAFTEEQLMAIDALGLTERQVRALATVKDDRERSAALALMSTGDEPGEAIANARKTIEVVRKKDEIDKLSDGDWLNEYCGDVRKRLGTNLKAFDTAAILYRRSIDALKVMRASISQDIRNARLQRADDPLTKLLGMACTLNHPMQWDICGMCSGGGSNENGVRCTGCVGGCGFKMTYGELKK